MLSATSQVWSKSFLADALFDGRRLRAVKVVDNFTKESWRSNSTSNQQLNRADVVAVVERLHHQRDLPQRIATSKGSEFISMLMDRCTCDEGVDLDDVRLHKPTDNPFIVSSGEGFKNERLNTQWFLSQDDTRENFKTEGQRQSSPHALVDGRSLDCSCS